MPHQTEEASGRSDTTAVSGTGSSNITAHDFATDREWQARSWIGLSQGSGQVYMLSTRQDPTALIHSLHPQQRTLLIDIGKRGTFSEENMEELRQLSGTDAPRIHHLQGYVPGTLVYGSTRLYGFSERKIEATPEA